jgi:hypothetical protein
MSHLSRDRLLEAVEAEASPESESAAHLASCWRCRSEVEALRRTLRDVRAVDVPEPSPLFWDHLTQRVRAAIDAEPVVDPASAPARPWWRPALAALLVLLAAVLVDRGVRLSRDRASSVAVVERGPAAPSVAGAGADLDAGDDWQFLVDLAAASAASAEEVHGGDDIDTHIGTADLGVSALSADEQRVLVKLLNDALAEGAGPRPVKGDV